MAGVKNASQPTKSSGAGGRFEFRRNTKLDSVSREV